MNNKNDIYKNLNEKGKRITRQKMILLDVLFENTDRMLSANDIHSLVPPDTNIDMDITHISTEKDAFFIRGLPKFQKING